MGSADCQRHDPLEGTGADGVIVTGAHRTRIPTAFRPILEQALKMLSRGQPGSSLYVYGSVATGQARVGISDVDLVTIGVAPRDARQLADRLGSTFRGLCRGVEIGPAQRADYEGASDEAHGNRVFLRHYCVHLWGPDLSLALPGYPADKAAARGFNGDIGQRAALWRTELADGPSPSLARRIARKTLFAVTGLVSVHDAGWTTDRALAARRWGEVRPDLASDLQGLACWAFGPAPQPTTSELHGVLHGAVAEVVADFERLIGLWRAPP